MYNTVPPLRLLRRAEVQSRLGISRTQFYRLVKAGRLPAGQRVSERVRGWREADINAFIEACPSADAADAADTSRVGH